MTPTTNTKIIKEQLEQLSLEGRYAFVRDHAAAFPVEIVQEAITYYFDPRRRNEEYGYKTAGKDLAITLAKNAGLIEELVQMYIETSSFTKTMGYPQIVQSRPDKYRIFEELESELELSDYFYGNKSQYARNFCQSVDYAVQVAEFGFRTGVDHQKVNNLVAKTTQWAFIAGTDSAGKTGNYFPFDGAIRLTDLLDQNQRENEAQSLRQHILEMMETENKIGSWNGRGFVISKNPAMYLQVAEKAFGNSVKAKEEMFNALRRLFLRLEDDPQEKESYNQKDSFFQEREKILDVMVSQGMPCAYDYKREYINWHINDFKRAFYGEKKEFQKVLTYAKEFESVALQKEIYKAAMEGLQRIVQSEDFKLRHYFNPQDVAQNLITEAFSFGDVNLLEGMLQIANQENFFDNVYGRENLTALITLAKDQGLLESLKPELARSIKSSSLSFDPEYFKLALEVKDRRALQREYETTMEYIDRRGWINDKVLELVRLMGDQKRVAAFEPLVELVREKGNG